MTGLIITGPGLPVTFGGIPSGVYLIIIGPPAQQLIITQLGLHLLCVCLHKTYHEGHFLDTGRQVVRHAGRWVNVEEKRRLAGKVTRLSKLLLS